MKHLLIILIFSFYSAVSAGCESESEFNFFKNASKDIPNDKLIEMASTSKKAQLLLGIRYGYSKRHDNDQKKSEYWMKKSSSNDCHYANAELGFAYFTGLFGEEDFHSALIYLNKAHDLNSFVNIGIGEIYARGLGVKRDDEKALEYFSSKKSLESPIGLYWMGAMHYKPQIGQPDYKKSFEFFSKAAEHGLAEAEFYVGHSYHFGKGVVKDLEKAKFWYDKAIKQGHSMAKFFLMSANNNDEEFELETDEQKVEFIKEVLRNE